MRNKKFNFLAIILIIVVTITFINSSYVSAKAISLNNKTEIVNNNSEKNTDILSLVDKYQEEYFAIVKRNNMLLNCEDDKNLNKDRKELKKLYKKVEKQITNKKYLKEYKMIEKRYSKCDDITTIGMNEFADKNYREVDNLLNKTYNAVKSKISQDDFNRLIESERKWLKEVDNYEKEYNSMDYGSIGTIIYYDYQINMRNFRTLLLMLYL